MGARYTEAQAKATMEYMKKKHTIKVIVSKEKADEYKAAAKAKGYTSLNKFIIGCIEQNLNQEVTASKENPACQDREK